MKKNKFVSLNIAGLFVATLVLGSVTANAAKVGETTSEGSVGFSPAVSSPAKPYDPTDPNFPPASIKPNPDGKGAGTTGVLRFERVPNFDFGTLAIKAEGDSYGVYDEEYQVVNDAGANIGNPFYSSPTVEVTDGRGHAPGWYVTVKNNGVFSATASTVADFNATIVFNNAVAAPYTKGVLATEAPEIKFDLYDTAKGALELNGSEQTIFNANDKYGNAQWGISFYDPTDVAASSNGKTVRRTTKSKSNAVQLKIPDAAKVTANQTYTTTIDWGLYDTPEI